MLKTAIQKHEVTYKDKAIRITAESLKAKWVWNDALQTLEENHCQPRLLYAATIIEGEKKSYDKIIEIDDHEPSTVQDTKESYTQ
jgi:hypothetical protein